VTLKSFWGLDQKEIDLLQPKPRPTITEWAPDNLYLPRQESPEMPGYFNFDYSPYLRQPADDLCDHYTREVWIQAILQGSKSTLGNIWLAYIILVNPNHTMICMPDENTVKRRMKTRLQPLFKANPKLLEAIGGRVGNLNIGEPTVVDWMNLYIGWSHSPSIMSDVPVCNIIADEVALFIMGLAKDVSPIDLLRGRQKRFPENSKFLGLSSPKLAGDLFDKEFRQGLIHKYYLQCPVCERYFTDSPENFAEILIIKKDEHNEFFEPRAYENDRDGRLAWFICPLCHAKLNEPERAYATQKGIWVPDGCTINEHGKIIGQIPASTKKSYKITTFALHPKWQPLNKLASMFVYAQLSLKAGNRQPLQNFRNNHQGETWEIKEKITKPNLLKKRIEKYQAGFVPYIGNKKELFIHLTAIDCGYEQQPVLDFCRSTESPIIAVRGDPKLTNRSNRLVNEKNKGPIYHLNVNVIKDRVYRLFFESDKPGPSYAHVHADILTEYFEHLSAEDRQSFQKGGSYISEWKLKSEHLPNHLLDCTVYATEAAEISGLWSLPNVPGVQFLDCGIDVHIDHVWAVVIGWGYMAECWVIWEGRLETGDVKNLDQSSILHDFLRRPWPVWTGEQKTEVRRQQSEGRRQRTEGRGQSQYLVDDWNNRAKV